MNREIKFRAWHHGGGDPRITPYMVFSHPFPLLFWKGIDQEDLAVEIMQYTGLKDKNGKEIYEGDVVEIKNKSIGHYRNNYIMNFQVIRDNKRCGFFLKNITSDGGWGGDQKGYRKMSGKSYLVIGNIYENPELLDTK